MNIRTKQYLRDALDEALALKIDLAEADFRIFSKSRQLQRITERSLEIIGEAIRRAFTGEPGLLPNQLLLRDWILLRNAVSHQYDSLILEVIWEAAKEELPELIETLEAMLDQTEHD